MPCLVGHPPLHALPALGGHAGTRQDLHLGPVLHLPAGCARDVVVDGGAAGAVPVQDRRPVGSGPSIAPLGEREERGREVPRVALPSRRRLVGAGALDRIGGDDDDRAGDRFGGNARDADGRPAARGAGVAHDVVPGPVYGRIPFEDHLTARAAGAARPNGTGARPEPELRAGTRSSSPRQANLTAHQWAVWPVSTRSMPCQSSSPSGSLASRNAPTAQTMAPTRPIQAPSSAL